MLLSEAALLEQSVGNRRKCLALFTSVGTDAGTSQFLVAPLASDDLGLGFFCLCS